MRWISVEDELPKPNQLVLIARKGLLGLEYSVTHFQDEAEWAPWLKNVKYWCPVVPPEVN